MVPATKIDESLSTAGQITAEDVAGIAAAGFSVIVNNRPDGEGGPDQPSSAVVGEAARVAGLSYKGPSSGADFRALPHRRPLHHSLGAH